MDELVRIGSEYTLPIFEMTPRHVERPGAESGRQHGLSSAFSFYLTKGLECFGDGGLGSPQRFYIGEHVRLRETTGGVGGYRQQTLLPLSEGMEQPSDDDTSGHSSCKDELHRRMFSLLPFF